MAVRDEVENRLSAPEGGILSVHMEEQTKVKYSYRFSLAAGKSAEIKDESEKAEVQSYINDILGLESTKNDRRIVPA